MPVHRYLPALGLALAFSATGAYGATTALERHVVATYKEYAWTLVFMDPVPGTALEAEKLPKLKRIFTRDLARAIADDQACQDRTGGICALGETILFGSQDPVALDMTVAATGLHAVDVCYKDQAGKKSCLNISGKDEDGRARIRDIVYPEGPSLRQMLHLQP